ncbi:MAG: MMPL family transporter [Brumimicrobium sp.]|nr:MMPL family transporter [Brumimicrobium sp.]
MWFKLSQLILRNRVLIIILLSVLTLVFGYYALTSLKTDNKYGNTLPRESPAQEDYAKLTEMFGEEGGTLVIAIKTDSLYTESNFLQWKKLGDSIANIPGVKSVFSEADLFNIINNTRDRRFEMEPIFSDETFQEKSIDEIREEVRRVPLYHNLLYNDSTHVSLMMINIDEAYLSDQKKQAVVFDIEGLAESYEKTFGKMHFAGLPHIRVILGKRVVNEMFIFIGIAILVTSILLYIFYRSWRIVMICNLVVFTAVIWSLGSIGMMGFKLSILMALIPPLMIVIGIPDCIYLLNNFHQEIRDHGNKIKALSRVIQKIGNATFMTNLTTAIGFSTFIFTNSDKLLEFGLSASLNIMMVFALSITIIPIVFSYQSQPKDRHLKHLEQKFSTFIVDKLVYYTTNRRTRIYWITAILVGLGIWGGSLMKATGNLTSDLPESDPILKDINFIQDNFRGVIPFEVLVNYKSDARKFDQTLLRKMEAVQNGIEEDTVFSKSLSIVSFMKLLNMAYYGNNPDMYKLIERKDMLRLKDYVQNFQEDVSKKQRLADYQNSLKEGDTQFADSILLNFPKIALRLIEQPNWLIEDSLLNNELFNQDSLQASSYQIFQKQVSEYLEQGNAPRAVLLASEQLYPASTNGLSIKELVDTTNTTYRIRLQIRDLGKSEMEAIIARVSHLLDSVLNPTYPQAMEFYTNYEKGDKSYIDSIFALSNAYWNNTASNIAGGDADLIYQFDMDPALLASYYDKPEMAQALRDGIEHEKLDYIITGTSVIVAEGTSYLIYNMFTSIIMAVIVISILMALLFGSLKMVLISMAPNLIPLIMTAGIMGFFAVPIKPSTLLVFSIALGITVDDTIHFLTKYRHELMHRSYNQKACIIYALRETGISMLYTSVVLFAGFSMFVFSQFGGTKALGLLISLTLLVAMLTNLILVPSFLLTIDKRITRKALRDPLFNVYDEEVDIELTELEIDPDTRIAPDSEVNPDDE